MVLNRMTAAKSQPFCDVSVFAAVSLKGRSEAGAYQLSV
jgi:hypothetical protein